MPVRVYTKDEQERLNKMNAASDATQLGTTIAVLQDAVNSGSGGGSFLSLSDTPASYAGQAGKVAAVNGAENAIEFITAGGSAYPDNVTIISGGGTHNLSLAEQGVVIVTDSTRVRLPASPPAGTTYKISGAAGLVEIDTNGALIAGYGSGIFRAGRVPLTIKALYLPGLIWGVENKNTYPGWFSDAAYGIGDRVQVGSIIYESRNDNNIGNDPASSPTWWHRVNPHFQKSNTVNDSYFTFI